ncbi:MAG: hypothetical protein RBT45_00575 [Acholeplasmataceae bacterium]|jgi:hypothetical protein|nr:hypothetical protein [Acholeplasmataceae bacterium]
MIKNLHTIGHVLIDIKKQMKDINMSIMHQKKVNNPEKTKIRFKSSTGDDVLGYYYKFNDETRPTVILIDSNDTTSYLDTYINQWLSHHFNVFVMQFLHKDPEIVCEQEIVNSMIHLIEFYQHAQSYPCVDTQKMIIEIADVTYLSMIFIFIEPYIVIIKNNQKDINRIIKDVDLSNIGEKTLLISIANSDEKQRDNYNQLISQMTTPYIFLSINSDESLKQEKIFDDIISYCISYIDCSL